MRFIRLVLIINLGLFAGPSRAGEEDPDINYAYAVFTGTGKYSLNDRTIYVFRAPLEFDLKPVNYDAGERPNNNDPDFRLEKSTELGIAIGFSRPFNILGYKLRQAGIGFEKSDDYEAITLYASFPF